jgi:Peptidase family S51
MSRRIARYLPRRVPQIIAIGGGGVSMEPENQLLDRYVLARSRRRNPSICFVASASGDADTHIARFYPVFTKHRCRPTHVPLFGRTPDLRQALLTQDVIYVGGGNTKSMLATWHEWGVPRVLRRAWRSGIVLAGLVLARFAGSRPASPIRGRADLPRFRVSASCPALVARTSTESLNADRRSIDSWPPGPSRKPWPSMTALPRIS